MRFRNAFVTLSLCAPSRAAFLTGRYNHLNGITDNGTPFPADAVTHATLLRAPVTAAYIGKWHMGNQRGQRPGFDYSASIIGHGRYQDCPFEINGVSAPTKGWLDDISTDFAIEWMRQNRQGPFSIVVGYKSPHSPRGGKNLPERLRDLYAGETSRPTPNCRVPALFHKPGSLAGSGQNLCDGVKRMAGRKGMALVTCPGNKILSSQQRERLRRLESGRALTGSSGRGTTGPLYVRSGGPGSDVGGGQQRPGPGITYEEGRPGSTHHALPQGRSDFLHRSVAETC